jgi:succinyl-CoA synthetase beta subunit
VHEIDSRCSGDRESFRPPRKVPHRHIGLLTGARGREQADLGAIVAATRAVTQLMMQTPEVQEVEVNPLFVYPDGVVAVDARVFMAE